MKAGFQEPGLDRVAAIARPLDDGLIPLIGKAGKASYVLIGEASHGTKEFYEIRADITKRLIQDHGFTVIALEADWPATLRVNHFVRGGMEEHDATDALGDFRRFPRWMWRNETMLRFIEWLREWNRPLAERQVGIFGMDLYSLHASISAVLRFLDQTDRAAARRARARYACFDHFGEDPQLYGYATTRGQAEACEDEVIGQLLEMRKRAVTHDAPGHPEDAFFAEQNAKVVADAEQYYRAMFRGRNESWNLRDAHMDETIRALARYYHTGEADAKVIVWAHNSHLGDSRATEMARRGEWNVGQLLKQRFGKRVFSIGFSTYSGTVTAAHEWDGEPEVMTVNAGLPGSYEDLFHGIPLPRFWIDLAEDAAGVEFLRQSRLQRAIGVIYRPESERMSHYFQSTLPAQFDAMIHLDRTSALAPLDRTAAPALDRPEADPAARV